MDNPAILDALFRWCSVGFAESVQNSGIVHVTVSSADVDAMRSIYLRRKRRSVDASEVRREIEGVLEALASVQDNEIGMLHFIAGSGDEGLVLFQLRGGPLYAFSIVDFDE